LFVAELVHAQVDKYLVWENAEKMIVNVSTPFMWKWPIRFTDDRKIYHNATRYVIIA